MSRTRLLSKVGRADVLMLRGKLSFGSRLGRGVTNALFCSALVLWGASTELITKLRAILSDAWYIKAE